MRRILTAVSSAALIAALSAAAADLPRRGALGLALQPVDGGGLEVREVLNPNAAGLSPGDVLLAVEGQTVASPYEIAQILRPPLKAGSEVDLRIRREGAERDVSIALMAAPPPSLDGRPLELSHVDMPDGTRVRTMLARPATDALTREGKAPVLMVIGGIPCQTEEVFGNAGNPFTKLYSRLTKAGFAVYVADKPGVGDSEGGPCVTGGFDVEVEAQRRVAKALDGVEGLDPDRRFLLGVSMGGVQGPLIATEGGFEGVVTWGTVVMPWADYLTASLRRRSVLEGLDMATMEPTLRAWRQVSAAAFVDGLDRAAIAAKMPDALKTVEEWAGSSIDGFGTRSLKFAQECDKANVAAAWQGYGGELLALHGEYDWVAEDYDHALAARILNAKRPGAATFEILKGLDHGVTRHATLADSFAKPFQGEPDDQMQDRIEAWLLERAKAEG